MMEAVSSPGFWWLKSSKSVQDFDDKVNITSTPKQTDDPSTISSSLREFLEKEKAVQSPGDADTDIGSIIEEINKLAAQSPLGPYEVAGGERSIEEIMREAEKIYLESSKSFEQLSARSRTSANLSVSLNESLKSTPTPKSASPLPLDSEKVEPIENNENPDKDESYSDDFTQGDESEMEIVGNLDVPPLDLDESRDEEIKIDNKENFLDELLANVAVIQKEIVNNQKDGTFTVGDFENVTNKEAIEKLEQENKELLENINSLKVQLVETSKSLEESKLVLNRESSLKSPEVNIELQKITEELKDSKETNTALQMQLDNLNKIHQLLKVTYEDLLASNNNLEKRLLESEALLSKFKTELENVQEHRDKLLESESSLTKLLEIERLQVKSLKAQNEKDARCIQDLNRQVKEMERIIARKHPDSVSALIVAAKSDQTENNLTARKVLEDRIKNLESEVAVRDQQSSKVFLDVQEKFTEMKNKYESHIEDLELHVNDLKNQLKRKVDTFDVYTQTFFDDQKIPAKESKDVSVQTIAQNNNSNYNNNNHATTKVQQQKKKPEKVEVKEETHLLATIRGLQADLVNKEKVVLKLQKELEEVKKTNKRLQKEREGSLKNIAEKREFRSYPEKLATHLKSNEGDSSTELEEELKAVKTERDKMRVQLCRIEEDYQNLKTKRLVDLSTLHDAHENEIAKYLANIKPLREQLDLNQVTLTALQEQLRASKEQIEILTVERDDLCNRLHSGGIDPNESTSNGNDIMNDIKDLPTQKRVALMEQRYQERERRLRAIVHGLAQKSVANVSCQQCSARQQQLILYKNELDQLLATLRTLT